MALFGDDTVFDNVNVAALVAARGSSLLEYFSFPRERRRRSQACEATERLLVDLGLESHREARARSLPYGLQRRVEIARALATRPSVLLLDEPTAGMNNDEAHQVGSTLVQIAAGGLGILLVEHNIGLVMDICSDVTVLDAGAVIARGSPATVTKDARVIDAYLGVA
jgi:ABC-type branched-subunit amino acid transport system ATPase component